ncbi:MAG: ATP-binding cassette domain-containing protein [Protaetiibacter sp.]
MTLDGLAARDLSFAYESGREVVSGWNAHFEPGTTTAITGPSGRGKSTLLYLLGLMLKPDGGDVLVDGVSTAKMPDADRAGLRAFNFGFVFQDASLDNSRTVMDNILEPALYRWEQPRSLLERGLELMDRFGVEVDPSRRPGQISGGQAQRIALCRALAGSPRVVLADEPTGNLDDASAGVVFDALSDHAHHGGVVVIVTHSSNIAAACDREFRL